MAVANPEKQSALKIKKRQIWKKYAQDKRLMGLQIDVKEKSGFRSLLKRA